MKLDRERFGLDLAQGELVRLESQGAFEVACDEGRVWLTAPWVRCSSAAAREKLSRRAAASNGRSADSGGRRRTICELYSQRNPKDIV